MAGLKISNVRKSFGEKLVLNNVSMHVEPGEFVALLGPSGCGKSTLLRLIAGFEGLDGGEIHLNGAAVSTARTHVPTERRGLGMVFQSYALWPHMSVWDNVAFALDVDRVPAAEKRKRVDQALESVGLQDYTQRQPAELSGGQRQRVALARTLAARNSVILLDEPLANLDANLRETMQDEFRRIHRETGATMIFVTHDQSEALALADRVAVMMDGDLRQIDTPRYLYNRPLDVDVARFIGRGSVLPVVCLEAGTGTAQVAFGGGNFTVHAPQGSASGPAEVCLRPENCLIAEETGSSIKARVVSARYTGPNTLVSVELCDGEPCNLLATCPAEVPVSPGDEVFVQIKEGWMLPVQERSAVTASI
ncbi:ABC transporter ATP-binding protein [Pseudovibrio sp. SPO723]|uniref:ABC transporter ATP-binding protein n=1 Tax=Nesiotobacter zosterae TaxID=392721 RepID=UPI0029C4BB10|nr:ABC transporter ATP-binding protein [Pseudovibrio sp. SPO723]MDX5594567.1 ABC transporter ATP-binding protein [Pseudovibrio sp. SPO723]